MREPGKEPPLAPDQERRSGAERRKTPERREEIRYEPGQNPRRSRRDRRLHQAWDDQVLLH